MSGDSLPSSRVDQLRKRCEALLDESLTLEAFARDLILAVVEQERLAAAAIVEFQSAQEMRMLAGAKLETLAVDGFYHIDPDHVSLLMQTLRQQKTVAITDRSVPEAGLKPHSIIIAPVPTKQAPIRLFELFTFNVPTPERIAQLKETADTLVAYFNRFLQEQANQQVAAPASEFWKKFDAFLLKLQQTLDLKRTIAVAVNDGRLLIGCDRLSIALKHGRRTKIYGVSGQDGVQQRANLVQLMSRLADAAIRLGNTVTYRGTIEDLPLPLEEPLANYLAESRTRMVQLVPLRQPAPFMPDEQQEENRRSRPERKIIGCLIVEQATEARPKQTVLERTQLLTEHIETAIDNCERYESIFLLPVWRALGRGVRWFKGRRLWIAGAILAGTTALGLALAFVPWEYRVEGKGQAMPVRQHEVFAPWDGDVREILVDSGQQVKAGEPLITLESDELDAERVATESEILEKRKLISSLMNQEHAVQRGTKPEDLARIRGELAKSKVELESAEAKLRKLQSRLEKLIVRAPADGVVATFQLKQLLQNRPVRRGEVLLEVMQPEGPWRLELEVPEYRMGHVMTAMRKSADGKLPVEYVLATSVETSHRGELTNIATRSNQSEKEGTIFECYADIDPADLPNRNIGAEVIAKIECGKKSLFYVLFGDVVEFLQQRLWF
ncbi:efflux RND transporter periplasmic adaptor subunit [Planctomicrobium sp. SH664]|uniref:efflux RND transporter periplasmic adaptor subunit n=1 Tax=Planctomicrobium sp. SH664 TaxID=3448125 RepID=UPI003F5BEE20